MTAPDRTAVEALRAFVEHWESIADNDWTFDGALAGGPTPEDPVLTLDILRAVLDAADEGFGHAARQREAEHALMLLLLREENASVEFTPAEMVRAPADGSFVSQHNVVTGSERLAFVAAKGGVKRG